MPSLSSLPFELVQQVFGHLTPSDLRAICLASRTLRAVAEPHLYSTIDWAWEWKDQLIAKPPIVAFLRTILQRPELGENVGSLVCRGSSFYWTNFSGKRPPKIPLDEVAPVLDDAVAVVKKLQVPFGQLWEQELRAGTMDAYIALLLLHLPRLEKISLQPSFAKETRILGMMLRSSLCDTRGLSTAGALQHLQDLTLIHRADMVGDAQSYVIENTPDVLPLFYLPKLQRMALSISNAEAFSWPGVSPPDPAHLTSLNLSTIREGYLGHVLQTTKSLTSLTWEWRYNQHYRAPFNSLVMDFDRIFHDLSHVRGTLTELVIKADLHPMHEMESMDMSAKGSRRPLRDFSKLKTLTCPQFVLLGFPGTKADRLGSILPPSIERLIITDDLTLLDEMDYCDRALLYALRDWLESSISSTPSIRSFCLDLHDSDVEWGPTMREHLRNLCAKVGVEVDIVKLDGDLAPMSLEKEAALSPLLWEYQWLD